MVEFIKENLPGDVPLELVKVDGGHFAIGSDKYERESSIHGVEISDFHLGKYPITNEQFLPFLQEVGNQGEGRRVWVHLEGQYESVRCGIKKTDGTFQCVEGLEHHPMIYVSWHGAKAFCKWLSEKTGHSYRLPSEAEWEYAAKRGHSQGFLYAGSNKLKEVGWYNTNSHRETKPVGLKLPNKLGLYDMSGNVFEWCEDHWHDDYHEAPKDGGAWRGDKENERGVVRGGAIKRTKGEWFVAGLGASSITTAAFRSASGSIMTSGTTMWGFGLPGTNTWSLLYFFTLFAVGERFFKK